MNNTIYEVTKLKYQNAKDWFFANWDNPKEQKRALKNYQEMADTLYYFEHGQKIRDITSSRDQACGDGLQCIDIKRFINRECVK